jgi:hypothetical protein
VQECLQDNDDVISLLLYARRLEEIPALLRRCGKMANRILVPFDISQYSLDASNEAIELAKLFGVSITFIHIVESEPYYDTVYESL